jgi:putative addiction module component (TIGR02574 family)
MDLQETLANVQTWPIGDQYALIEGLLENLPEEPEVQDISDKVMQLIDERLERQKNHPAKTYSWEEVKESLRSQEQP